MAVMRPAQKGKTPIVALVVSGKRYLALVRETQGGNFPPSWIENTEEEGIWFSTGVQNEVIDGTQGEFDANVFRGSGSPVCPPSISRMAPQDLLATPTSRRSCFLSDRELLETPRLARSVRSLNLNELLATPRRSPSCSHSSSNCRVASAKGILQQKLQGLKKKTRLRAKTWRCPECDHMIKIHNQTTTGKYNYLDIPRHWRKFHPDVHLEQMEVAKKNGHRISGLGIRK